MPVDPIPGIEEIRMNAVVPGQLTKPVQINQGIKKQKHRYP